MQRDSCTIHCARLKQGKPSCGEGVAQLLPQRVVVKATKASLWTGVCPASLLSTRQVQGPRTVTELAAQETFPL